MKSEKNSFKIHSIKYNLLMNIILKISAFIFPLITFPYVSRVLGAGPNGKISFAASVISYFSLLAGMGIPSYGIRKCAEIRDDKDKLSKTVQELLLINSFFTICSYLVLIITIVVIPKFRQDSLLFYITSITIVFNTLGIDWFYQAIEQYDYITIRNIFFKVIAIILMLLFIHKPSDYILYAGISVFGNVGSNILNMLRVSKYISFKRYPSYSFQPHIKPIFMLFLYNATTTIFTNLDQVMLGFMSTSKEVGYYAATVKIKNILTSLITALGSVMLPRVAYYLKKGNSERFVVLIKQSFNFIIIVAIPISVYFILESKAIILFLAGEGYERASMIMQWIAPSIIFIGLSSVTAWQILIPMKKEKVTVIGAVVGAVINVIVNILCIPKFGGVGAAIGTGLAELGVFLTHCIALREKIKQWIDLKEVLLGICVSLISAGILVIFNSVINLNTSYFFECLATAFLFFVSYGLLLLVFKEPIVNNTVKNFFSRIK